VATLLVTKWPFPQVRAFSFSSLGLLREASLSGKSVARPP